MKPISGLYLALFIACGTQAAYAQTPTQQRPAGQPGARPGAGVPQQGGAQLRGTVVDAATGRPIASATVAVRSRADSALVGGAVTRADGSFRVEGLRPGRYSVRVSHLGHTATTVSEVTVAPGATTAEVPAVRLAASAVQLEGITATAARSEVRMSADRNVFSTRDMPAAAGGNSTDVLRNVPAVEVDQDGKVSLRGNQNVAVQINGRAAPMTGDQLGQFLQQLPANMVDRVEVIPNPSAKYDPEGMSGIVNIVLKANADLGISGGTTLAAGTNDRLNGSGNLGYQRGALTLFGSVGLSRDGRDISGFANRTSLRNGVPFEYTNQLLDGEGRAHSHNVNTSAEYKLSKESSFASTFLVSGFGNDNKALNDVRRLGASGDLTSRSNALQFSGTDANTLDGTLSFRRVVQPRQNELSVEARYTRTSFDDATRFITEALTAQGQPTAAGSVPVRNLATDAANSERYLQADLTRMVSGVRVETGYKGQLRTVDNDITAERYVNGAWTDEGSNVFGLDEQVHALYGVLTRNAGPFELQGGLRLERTDRGTNRADDELEPFTDYFPSALVAYNLDESRQVKASYSKRIQRPQTQLLNSFYRYEGDLFNRFRGNPYLRPEYTDAYELGFQQSGRLGSLQLTPFYRHTVGAIRRTAGVGEVVGTDTVYTSTVENLATANSYGADANLSIRAGRVTGSLGTSVFGQNSDGGTVAGLVSTSTVGWSARGNANVRLSKRTDLQVFGMYRAPMDTEFGRQGAFAMTNFALRQKFLNDKASVTFRVQDPFNTMRFSSYQYNTDTALGYQLDSERRFGARGAFISFNYTFGQTPRLRAPRQQEPQSDPGQPIGTTP